MNHTKEQEFFGFSNLVDIFRDNYLLGFRNFKKQEGKVEEPGVDLFFVVHTVIQVLFFYSFLVARYILLIQEFSIKKRELTIRNKIEILRRMNLVAAYYSSFWFKKYTGKWYLQLVVPSISSFDGNKNSKI